MYAIGRGNEQWLCSFVPDRQFYENLPLEKKRTYYKHKKFVTLGDIETWSSKRQSQGMDV